MNPLSPSRLLPMTCAALLFVSASTRQAGAEPPAAAPGPAAGSEEGAVPAPPVAPRRPHALTAHGQ